MRREEEGEGRRDDAGRRRRKGRRKIKVGIVNENEKLNAA